MNKIYLIGFVFLTLVSTAKAQNDPAAKKILDGVSAKIKNFKAITATFSLKSITSKGKDNGTKVGSVSLKGQKYVMKQNKVEIICDGAKIYNFDGNKTITVSSVEDAGSTLSPQILLSNFYDKDYTYKLISAAGNFYQIELLPNDKRKNVQKINIYIDKAKSFITKAKVLDKSNNTIELSISNPNTNATLNDNIFQFNKAKYPKDIEVLD
ncbi:LolA family protein [Parasediminibacterium sp. JCM 36343]|uniref:LolA family protein n=1 Tax=Parasediminibacterium sp. JCM 36343 TaxID=3374279 RepID=UPI00397A5DC2